jgi:hypothetical protein
VPKILLWSLYSDFHLPSSPIDTIHSADLMVALANVTLVDANRVDPDKVGLGRMSHPS